MRFPSFRWVAYRRGFMGNLMEVTVTLNPDGVSAPALRAARKASEIVSIALPAIQTADLSEPKKLGFFSLHLGTSQSDESRRAEYVAWILARGFQELAVGVRASLEEAYHYVKGFRLASTSTSRTEIEQGLQHIRRRAGKLNFPDLLTGVEEELQATLQFRDEMRSMQKARNCLEHRAGMVAPEDRDGEKLVLRLPRLKVFHSDETGSEIEIRGGEYFEKETRLSIKLDIKAREYAIGSRISFDANEFHEIAMACVFFANDVKSKLPMPAGQDINCGPAAGDGISGSA